MNTNNNLDGQKHCSCKKSKCLKLYCDCFAAGYYCDDACTCQECFNILDYEDTVEETRQLIELRNPLAFSTKIHNVEEGDSPTTVARKHKRGCNCKKSMCIKRYCECYQANVKCSDECRCEGCKNVFGKKGEYNVYNDSSSWTPSQHSGQREDASTTDLFAGCYTPIPDSTNSDTIIGTINGNYVDDQMDGPNGSRASENDSSVVTPVVSQLGGSEVDKCHEKPVDNICDKTTKAPRDSNIDPDTGTMTSSSDK